MLPLRIRRGQTPRTLPRLADANAPRPREPASSVHPPISPGDFVTGE
jgi:hypothetical protein